MSGVNIRKYPANAGNVGGTRAASGIRYIVIHYTGNDGDTAIFQPTRPLRGATAKVYKSLCTFLR